MSEDRLASPVRESGSQPVEHRPAKNDYVPPELKIFGKMWELTASGTGSVSEFADDVDGTGGCLINPNASSCQL